MSDKIIRFEKGIPGFVNEKEFVLLMPEQDSPFAYLQSIKTEELSFVVVSPFFFFKDYEFDLSQETINRLNVKNIDDVIVLTIVSVRENLKDATTNLVAPIIINAVERLAEQMILEGMNYTTQHRLFPQTAEIVGGE